MGLIYTGLELSNPRNASMNSVKVGDALVDTGAMHLCIPEKIRIQLDLEEQEKRTVTTADGKTHSVPYVGPIKILFDEHRSCMSGALVLGDQVLLGAIPMEDMDLVLSPAKRRVIANPESPNIPMSIAKGVN